jgi:hypothetical protein
MWRVAEELILVMGIHLSAMIEASELTIYQILGGNIRNADPVCGMGPRVFLGLARCEIGDMTHAVLHVSE